MLMYTRNFLFSLRNCWKSTSKNLGYGLMHRPLSRQVWLTLKHLNLLAPRRGQRGRNHLRRPDDRPINVIIRVERQQNFQEKRRGANQSNLLNIPVDIFAAKTTSHGTLHSTIHGNNFLKSKVTVAHLNVRSLKTREHLIQVRNLMDEKKYAILAISKSWLNSSVKNAEVEIDGYSLLRLDRPRNIKNEFGGGVCAYMPKTLKSKLLKDLSGISDTGFQQLWMQVQHKTLKSFLLCVTYKPPDCNVACFKDFRDRYTKALVYGLPILVVGDLNCDLLVNSSNSRTLSNLCTSLTI